MLLFTPEKNKAGFYEISPDTILMDDVPLIHLGVNAGNLSDLAHQLNLVAGAIGEWREDQGTGQIILLENGPVGVKVPFRIDTKAVEEVPEDIITIAEARAEAKKARDFGRADLIRQYLLTFGWAIRDTPKGYELKRLSPGG